MKKIEYKAPEMEIIKLAVQRAVLQPESVTSGSTTPISNEDGDKDDF